MKKLTTVGIFMVLAFSGINTTWADDSRWFNNPPGNTQSQAYFGCTFHRELPFFAVIGTDSLTGCSGALTDRDWQLHLDDKHPEIPEQQKEDYDPYQCIVVVPTS